MSHAPFSPPRYCGPIIGLHRHRMQVHALVALSPTLEACVSVHEPWGRLAITLGLGDTLTWGDGAVRWTPKGMRQAGDLSDGSRGVCWDVALAGAQPGEIRHA